MFFIWSFRHKLTKWFCFT